MRNTLRTRLPAQVWLRLRSSTASLLPPLLSFSFLPVLSVNSSRFDLVPPLPPHSAHSWPCRTRHCPRLLHHPGTPPVAVILPQFHLSRALLAPHSTLYPSSASLHRFKLRDGHSQDGTASLHTRSSAGISLRIREPWHAVTHADFLIRFVDLALRKFSLARIFRAHLSRARMELLFRV
jgi:hypothetical protein